MKYKVMFEHQNHRKEWSAMKVEFPIEELAIKYAKSLKINYPNVRNIEVVGTIPFDVEEEDDGVADGA